MKTVVNVAAFVFAAVTIGCFVLMGFSSFFSEPKPQDMFVDDDATVALATAPGDYFKDLKIVTTPIFTFAVNDDMTWTIHFYMSVHADNASQVNGLAPLAIFMPLDADKCGRDRPADAKDQNDNKYITRVDIPGPKDDVHNALYKLNAYWGIDEKTNETLGVYSLHCTTRSLRTTSAGIVSEHFEITYVPAAGGRLGLSPGVVGLVDQLNIAVTTTGRYQHRDAQVTLKNDDFNPPTTRDVAGIFVWTVGRAGTTSFAVSGTVSENSGLAIERWRDRAADTWTGWLTGTLVAACVSWFAVKKAAPSDAS